MPRVWQGMTAKGWLKLLLRNRFAVSPRRVAMVLIIAAISVFNSLLGLLQILLYGRAVAQTEIEQAPIFIVGHWRSGTTLLHELLILDRRHTYPNTFACFAPNHFLLSTGFVTWWMGFLLPSRRPMDNIRIGWERPQEDEFALCNMGIPSPYLAWVFSNRPPPYPEYLDLRNVPSEALARWKRAFVWFLKCVTFQTPKRIVLKSPAHTCRIPVLLDLFPDARFVHIVRDPYAVFPSAIKTWKRLYKDQGAQVPKYAGLEEHVLRTFRHMYEVFEEDRKLIDPSRICDIRYEELISDPVEQVRLVYERLGLGGFEEVRPALQQYAAGTANYKTDRYELPPELRQKISNRWGAFINRYGYRREPNEPQPSTAGR